MGFRIDYTRRCHEPSLSIQALLFHYPGCASNNFSPKTLFGSSKKSTGSSLLLLRHPLRLRQTNFRSQHLRSDMAAETILSAFLPVILDKLISPAIQQLSLTFGTDQKLQKLKRILEGIQSVLADAEDRQNAETNIKNWLSDLKDLAYTAEDVLDDFNYEAVRKQRPLNNMRTKVLFYCSFYKPVITRFSLCRRLNDTIEKIEAIAEEIHKFNLQLNKVPQISYGRPQTDSYVDKEEIIGREEDKEDIVKLLINHVVSNNKKIMVLPIVAMGGMGKTTLSQLVYRDHRVEVNFRLRMWVCVSDADFDVARLVRLIIEAATKKVCKVTNMELLQDQLREIISEKRYLLVLDDVWNENQDHWDRLKRLLDCGGEGSAVLVSTRSTLAAQMMTTHTICDLKQLSEEDSWELFRRRAFAEGAEEPANLVKIGKDIIKRCGRLPFAINTLGKMMGRKNKEEWKAVLDSEIWELQAAKDNILPALRLSYNYLPSQLKQCFAFCAIYPKDYEMEKDTLIKLWMANGYIPSVGKRKGGLEAKGEDIFDELTWRSFFQNVKEETEYKPNYGYRYRVTCKMHDLMHDLARSVMGNECLNFAHILKWEDIQSTVRHLRIEQFTEVSSPGNQPVLSTIRTIEMSGINAAEHFLPIMYSSKLKSLRVLGLLDCDMIVHLRHWRHMRYLDLSKSQMKKLPGAICSLYNLQTLKLSFCEKLKKLPNKLTNLVNLRHLYIDGCCGLDYMPRGMGSLKQLHTLTGYIVSSEAERGINQLRDLNLHGRLEISGIEKVSNATEAEDASLLSKQNLFSISLKWEGASSLEVFEALKPHDGLRILKVSGYGGQQFPNWLNVLQLQNLVEIHLCGCKSKELPPLGQLQFLEFLFLWGMYEVKHIISKTTQELHTTLFPSLKCLRINSVVNLNWWEADGSNAQILPDRRQIFPCLMDLRIYRWENLTAIPTIPSLKYLHLSSCNGLASLPDGMESLTELEVSICRGLASLPDGMESLTELEIDYCDALTSLPDGMESLTELIISDCNGLTSLPEGLIKLHLLRLDRCDGLVSLPEGMECLTHLKSLAISECNKLSSLPEGLQLRLPSLSELEILGQDELIMSFQFGGEYWHLIQNIPKREIRQHESYHESSTSGEKCNVISRLLSISKYRCLRQSF